MKISAKGCLLCVLIAVAVPFQCGAFGVGVDDLQPVHGRLSTPNISEFFHAAVAAATLLGGSAAVRQPACDTLIAHRGESHDAPENMPWRTRWCDWGRHRKL